MSNELILSKRELASLKQRGFISESLDLSQASSLLLKINSLLNFFSRSQGEGGISISLRGVDSNKISSSSSNLTKLRWGLSANANTGPEIPCTPAIIITSKLHHLYKYRNAQISPYSLVDAKYRPGARVCADMLSLYDFTDAIHLDKLDIQQYVYSHHDEMLAETERDDMNNKSHYVKDDKVKLSPTFTALDFVSQSYLPAPISAVHATGGIVTGGVTCLYVVVSSGAIEQLRTGSTRATLCPH